MASADPSVRAGERVYSVLKERLLDGHYRPDQRLNADGLAAELDVSRQPVFDAFKRLSTEGLVSVKPHVGCRVATYDMAEVRDYFHMFAAVEGAASALAAQRRSDEALKALRRLHAQIGGLADLPTSDERAHAYRALNREFHSLVHTMCGTRIVESFGAAMYDRADFFINSSSPVSPFADSIPGRHREHAAIVAAIETGDAEGARTAASAHIFETVALIQRTIGRSTAPAVG
jgi:DNA-binding GntR family transcriptional regulator